jgi:hypothetical protein
MKVLGIELRGTHSAVQRRRSSSLHARQPQAHTHTGWRRHTHLVKRQGGEVLAQRASGPARGQQASGIRDHGGSNAVLPPFEYDLHSTGVEVGAGFSAQSPERPLTGPRARIHAHPPTAPPSTSTSHTHSPARTCGTGVSGKNRSVDPSAAGRGMHRRGVQLRCGRAQYGGSGSGCLQNHLPQRKAPSGPSLTARVITRAAAAASGSADSPRWSSPAGRCGHITPPVGGCAVYRAKYTFT